MLQQQAILWLFLVAAASAKHTRSRRIALGGALAAAAAAPVGSKEQQDLPRQQLCQGVAVVCRHLGLLPSLAAAARAAVAALWAGYCLLLVSPAVLRQLRLLPHPAERLPASQKAALG
jgi:hypothetical protein